MGTEELCHIYEPLVCPSIGPWRGLLRSETANEATVEHDTPERFGGRFSNLVLIPPRPLCKQKDRAIDFRHSARIHRSSAGRGGPSHLFQLRHVGDSLTLGQPATAK